MFLLELFIDFPCFLFASIIKKKQDIRCDISHIVPAIQKFFTNPFEFCSHFS